MNSLVNNPDPRGLGRISHLRILTVNLNTVRHLREGSDGRSITWTTSNGEQCEAKFQYEQPELEPRVLNGERVEWINPTDQPCTIVFDPDESTIPPFEDGKRQFMIGPGKSVFSSLIKGKIGQRYSYLVNFAVPPNSDDDCNRGNPVIIVKG